MTVHVDPSARNFAKDAGVGALVAPEEGEQRDSDTYGKPDVNVHDYRREEGGYPDERVQLAALPRLDQVGELGEHPFEGYDDDGRQDALESRKLET